MITRLQHKLFIVLVAPNDHGKTHLVNHLLTMSRGIPSPGQKGKRTLTTLGGRVVEAIVFVRSYQEEEKKTRTVPETLAQFDQGTDYWFERELIIIPSHPDTTDVTTMITEAHDHGYDAILAALLRTGNTIDPTISTLTWNERWTLRNPDRPTTQEWQAQVQLLATQLWSRISDRLEH
jgi:hypothetical protein